MRFKSFLQIVSAAALTVAPVAASAAPVANPAASLSLSPGVRAGATTAKQSKLAGRGIFAAIIGLGIIAIIVIAVVNGNNDNNKPASP